MVFRPSLHRSEQDQYKQYGITCMQQSISKDDFLINNPKARPIVLSGVSEGDFRKMMIDCRFFIQTYFISNNKYKVLCHV